MQRVMWFKVFDIFVAKIMEILVVVYYTPSL
jgi:hypothetical protein